MANIEIFHFIIVGLLVAIGHGEILEFDGHRAGIYIDGSSSSGQIFHLFKKISETIGVYGLFSYENNRDLANEMKNLFENAIEKNVAANGEVMGEWKPLLKKTMSETEKMLRVKLNETFSKTELVTVVIVTDKHTATQAKWIQKLSSKSKETPNRHLSKILSGIISKIKTRRIESGVDVFTPKDTKFLYISTGYSLTQEEGLRAESLLMSGMDLDDAIKESVIYGKKCDQFAKEYTAMIAIELGYKKN